MKLTKIEEKRLIKKAHKLIDRIESNLDLIVKAVSSKQQIWQKKRTNDLCSARERSDSAGTAG